MESDIQANNKRIAKNAIMLYVRMFVIMAISLFTSRVCLQALGVEDFGIYNVVGGLVAMMGIVNNTMGAATQRYLNYALGKNDNDLLNRTFSISLMIYFLLCVFFFIASETIGLWFLNTKMTIPENRMYAANCCYQFSVFTVINTLLVNPYNAAIIAHERMNIYAYVSIIEAVLKLLVAYGLYAFSFDKLILYGCLYLVMSVCVTMIYRVYCIHHFNECHFSICRDKELFKSILGFSSWNLFGAISSVVKGQGLNVLLNLFFNPSVNASRGIAYQVNNTITHFSGNFYAAVRPQIVKYYAKGDFKELFNLIFRSSKMSFALVYIISLPVIIEAPHVIQLWLGQTPEYAVSFFRIIIFISIMEAIALPLNTTSSATGRVKYYQIIIGGLIILTLPISFIFLKIGGSALTVFEVSFTITTICLFLRAAIIKFLIPEFPLLDFYKDIIGRSTLTVLISVIIPILCNVYISYSMITFVTVLLLSLFSASVSIYFVLLNKSERNFVVNVIKTKINK